MKIKRKIKIDSYDINEYNRIRKVRHKKRKNNRHLNQLLNVIHLDILADSIH